MIGQVNNGMSKCSSFLHRCCVDKISLVFSSSFLASSVREGRCRKGLAFILLYFSYIQYSSIARFVWWIWWMRELEKGAPALKPQALTSKRAMVFVREPVVVL